MIEFSHVSYAYGRRQVLKDINFSVRPHTITALLGRNGCGKSTLVSCLAGQLNYLGNITLNGREVKSLTEAERSRTISVLPQCPAVPDISVRELISFGRYPYLGWQKKLDEQNKRIVDRAITDTGLTALADESVKNLSGGERQRAFFAMILANDSRITVLDEPTTYMDIDHQKQLMDFTVELKRRKKTVIIVTHDISAALKYADSLAVIDSGCIAFQGDRDTCIKERILEKTFGRDQIVFERNGRKYVFFE